MTNAKTTKSLDLQPWQEAQAALPGTLKDEVDTKARELIETVLKPKHVQPPPTGHQLNYITDITTKWLGSKCYFVSIYACPGPNAISPSFETKFARMEYVGDGKLTWPSCGTPASGSGSTRACCGRVHEGHPG